ncbi:MAG: DUF2189 domain-containing protein [Geminicoccaceae bacterium]|nr:DUF2189 domain-containing protein [Geminicoccaceae bacterium]
MAEAVPVFAHPKAIIKRLEMDQPWSWLARGWKDFRAEPTVGLTYGILAAITGYVITAGLYAMDAVYLILPLMAGFLIVGPILTVGVYEVSRRLESGQSSSISDALASFGRNLSQLALMGVALMLLMFLWARIAALLFFLYFGMDPPSFENLFVETFLSAGSWKFLIVGSAIGSILSLLAFAISVVSIPMLLDHPEMNVIEAIATSFKAVQTNPGPMLFWAALIVVFSMVGLLTLYLGLVVTLPLIGHATWHAYRDTVELDPVEEG